MKRFFLLSIIPVLLLSSCGDNVVFRQYNIMENLSWNRFDFQEFEVRVEQGDILDFYLALRHHTDFPYKKLWVNVTFYPPDGSMRSRDYDFMLKDAEGNWIADGMGELWDIELLIRKEMLFTKTGICKVRIENKHSKYEIPGVIEVGLIVRKSGG